LYYVTNDCRIYARAMANKSALSIRNGLSEIFLEAGDHPVKLQTDKGKQNFYFVMLKLYM
jgi:hypothetical protein